MSEPFAPHGIDQNGMPPHTMTCKACGKVWDPDPVSRGPNAGQHTDSSLAASAATHFKDCKDTK